MKRIFVRLLLFTISKIIYIKLALLAKHISVLVKYNSTPFDDRNILQIHFNGILSIRLCTLSQ